MGKKKIEVLRLIITAEQLTDDTAAYAASIEGDPRFPPAKAADMLRQIAAQLEADGS